MSSQEELAMLTDAKCIPEEQRMENAAAQIYAIQTGLELGKKRGKKFMLAKSAMFVLTAAVMVVGLLFINPSTLLPQQSSPSIETSDWGVLETFKKLALVDIDAVTIDSAIRNDYVQIINKSVEKDGYKITLNAVLADENEIILLYTGTTNNAQEIYSVNSAKLTDALTGRTVADEDGNGGGMGSHADDSIYEWYGKTIIPLDRNNPAPNEVVADFQITSVDPGMLGKPKTGTILADMRYSERLKVNFTIDPKFWEQKTETVVLNQSFEIDGYEVKLAEVEISPLRIVAKYALNEELKTEWELRNNLFAEIPRTLLSQVGQEKTLIMPNSGRGTEEGFDSYFSSNILDHPKSIRLKLDAGPDREKEAYIDILK